MSCIFTLDSTHKSPVQTMQPEDNFTELLSALSQLVRHSVKKTYIFQARFRWNSPFCMWLISTTKISLLSPAEAPPFPRGNLVFVAAAFGCKQQRSRPEKTRLYFSISLHVKIEGRGRGAVRWVPGPALPSVCGQFSSIYPSSKTGSFKACFWDSPKQAK